MCRLLARTRADGLVHSSVGSRRREDVGPLAGGTVHLFRKQISGFAVGDESRRLDVGEPPAAPQLRVDESLDETIDGLRLDRTELPERARIGILRIVK